VFDGSGRPQHQRGVTDVPGLYFLGLPWMHTWGSGRLLSVGRDADHLAQRIRGVRVLADMGLAGLRQAG
jgi:putative flavoprotein involved in K+ transport